MSRVIKFQKSNRQVRTKILIGILILSVSVGTSIRVAFADSDINGLLSGWFQKKGTESISTIEQAVMTEKETQKERLKQELQVELQNAAKQMSDFTDQEKAQRIQAIKDYADQLIANMKIDNKEEEQQIINKLNSIVERASAEMNNVVANISAPSNDKNNEKENTSTKTPNNDNDNEQN